MLLKLCWRTILELHDTILLYVIGSSFLPFFLFIEQNKSLLKFYNESNHKDSKFMSTEQFEHLFTIYTSIGLVIATVILALATVILAMVTASPFLSMRERDIMLV
jgi:hypothetical protein